MIFSIYDGMKLRNIIHKLISEAIGDQRFESGAITYGGDQLILFAENDKSVYDFAIIHRDDKMAIYNYVIARYEKQFGTLEGDRETIMYDFLANYEPPEQEKKELDKEELAKDIFGGYVGGKVKFDQDWGRGFIVNVSPSFISDAVDLASKKGYECKRMTGIPENHDGTFSMIVSPRI